MRIGPYSPVSIAAALLALVALLSASAVAAAGLDLPRTEVSALLIGSAHAAEAKPLAAAEDLEWKEFERFITRNPGTMLGGVALPDYSTADNSRSSPVLSLVLDPDRRSCRSSLRDDSGHLRH